MQLPTRIKKRGIICVLMACSRHSSNFGTISRLVQQSSRRGNIWLDDLRLLRLLAEGLQRQALAPKEEKSQRRRACPFGGMQGEGITGGHGLILQPHK